jgi:hypothetical protein
MKTVAALFIRTDSVYKLMPGVECYDAERDATSYTGPHPIVAHPPCRLFGVMKHFSKADPVEKQLAHFAIERARLLGGVVEHPAHSLLWREARLSGPGSAPDSSGGVTIELNQFAFGHKALKPTWLYVVRCSAIPTLPVEMGKPAYCIARKTGSKLLHVTKPAREHTPSAFAAWLVETARRCS